MSNNTKITEKLDMNELKRALQTARDQFAAYAELHRAKGPSHEEKVARNEQLVAMCDASLAQPDQDAASAAAHDRALSLLDEQAGRIMDLEGQLATVTAERDQLRAEGERALAVRDDARITDHPIP